MTTIQRILQVGNLRAWGFPFFRPVRVRLSQDRFPGPRRGWVLRVDLGRGAGYIWGRTLFVSRYGARTASSPVQLPGGFIIGFTRNANAVPYTLS